MRTFEIAMVLSVIGCGPGARDDGAAADAANPTVGPDGSGGATGDDGGTTGCTDSAKLVYTVDQNNTLSQFDPATKTFHDLGVLGCSTTAQPYSMSVDRDTIGWVLYTDGGLYRVDILGGLACTKTSWASASGLFEFGMGFSTDTMGSTDDTLFIAGGLAPSAGNTTTLASLDTSSMAATSHGTLDGWPELTGNANAELWGWFPSDQMGMTMPHVDQLDKATGASVQTYPLPTLKGIPNAWAFAYWGGDYWVFLRKDTELFTTIYQVDGTNGSIKSTTPLTLRAIVGAGVSTCAPTVIL